MSVDTFGLEWAIKFHELYERLSSDFGYETRPDTRQFESESKNGQLMIAVCGELVRTAEAAALEQGAKECDRLADEYRARYYKYQDDPLMQRFMGGCEVGADESAEAVRALKVAGK